MELLQLLIHFDSALQSIISLFGPMTYVILFLIVFAETGLVVTPFLPGDSLIFAVGALAGREYLNIFISYAVLLGAAILGDTVNYWIGYHLGGKVFAKKNSRIFKPEYLEKTSEFYAKHGGKTIILARFVPVVRTFAPFVAGVGKMHYRTFITYNVVGGFVWVTALLFAGYFFGQMEFVKKNFEYVVIGIVAISVLPMIYEFAKHKLSKEEKKSKEETSYDEIQKMFKKEHLND